MNGNFKPASCSQPNPRGDLSLAAVGQKRVGWAASESSFPCQKVSKASHTFPSSLRRKNTMPPHFEAHSLLPAASKPRGKPLPPVGPHGAPAPRGKRTHGGVRAERPPTKSAGERGRGREGGLAPGGLLHGGCVDNLPLPAIGKDHTTGQQQLLEPSESRVPRAPPGHGRGGHPQLSASPGPSPLCAKPALPSSCPGHAAACELPGAGGPPVHPSHSREVMVGRGERCRAEGAGGGGGGWGGEEVEEEEEE